MNVLPVPGAQFLYFNESSKNFEASFVAELFGVGDIHSLARLNFFTCYSAPTETSTYPCANDDGFPNHERQLGCYSSALAR